MAAYCTCGSGGGASSHCFVPSLPPALRRSFAGEALERERFGTYVNMSYHSGVGFAGAKANLEALSRCTCIHRVAGRALLH